MFTLPFGAMDARLLTERLRRQMASPGLVPGPLPTVELKPGYRPPSGAPAGLTAPAVPGFDLKTGFDALDEALKRFKRPPKDAALEEARRRARVLEPYPGANAQALMAGISEDANIGGGWRPPPPSPVPPDFLNGQLWPKASYDNFRA